MLSLCCFLLTSMFGAFRLTPYPQSTEDYLMRQQTANCYFFILPPKRHTDIPTQFRGWGRKSFLLGLHQEDYHTPAKCPHSERSCKPRWHRLPPLTTFPELKASFLLCVLSWQSYHHSDISSLSNTDFEYQSNKRQWVIVSGTMIPYQW